MPTNTHTHTHTHTTPPIPSGGNLKSVCVTGCNGYVACELVKQLLEKGYHVRGTVRSLHPRSKYAFLEKLAETHAQTHGGACRLELFEADLTKPGSFDEAVRGCVYVFHVASPVVYDTPNPEKDLVRPAVEGVTNIIAAITNAREEDKAQGRPSAFKRLILTSSTGAIYGGPAAVPKAAAAAATPTHTHTHTDTPTETDTPPDTDTQALFTEDDWNDIASISNFPYYYSKVVAEQKAWTLTRTHNIDMISVCPAYVWGPPAAREAGTHNMRRLKSVLRGEEPPWKFDFPVCDTRDIACVQIAGAETEGAKGRYLVSSSKTVTPLWIVRVCDRCFPGRFPLLKVEDGDGGSGNVCVSKRLFDVSKVEELLGRPLRAPEETLREMVEVLVAEEEEGGEAEERIRKREGKEEEGSKVE